MAEPRMWVFGDPEPAGDVDAVYFESADGERDIWWRFGPRWQAVGMHPLGWIALSSLGTLTEGREEER